MRGLQKILLAFCLFAFAGVGLAAAQNVEEPSSDPSIRKFEMLQDQMMNAEPSNDEEMAAAEANITPDEPMSASIPQAVQETNAEMDAYGYENIPGFTFTGNEDQDAQNWNNAMANLRESDPQRWQDIVNRMNQ